MCTGQQTLLSGLLLSRNVLPVKVSVSIVWQMIDTTFLKCPQILFPPSIAHWFNSEVENVLKHVRFASCNCTLWHEGSSGDVRPCPVSLSCVYWGNQSIGDLTSTFCVSPIYLRNKFFSPQNLFIICLLETSAAPRYNLLWEKPTKKTDKHLL